MGTVNNFGNVLLPAGSNTIDVQTLLNSAIQAASMPMQMLQQRRANVQTQSSALQSIQTDINALGTAVSALSDNNGAMNSFTATSSDSKVLSATADPTASAGTHLIVVSSLATTSSYYTNPVASPTTTIATGTFQIAVGSNPAATVTIDNTNNTLSGLAAAINGQNLGVTASVITDANGSRLALVSNTSGAAGSITVSGNTTGLTFNQAATGANASLTVDGVPISSSSNTISSVIPGVTLNLNGASPNETVALTLSPDVNQATSAINTFVSAWNKVMGDLNSEFDVTSTGGGGPLEADNTLRAIQNQLLSGITYAISGNNGIVNLASIGVNMNDDGTLAVDSGKLSNVLNNNFGAVHSLLQGTAGFATMMSTTLTQITDPAQGLITVDLQGMSQENQDLTQQINTMQAQLKTKEQLLTQQYAQMETVLQEMPGMQNQLNQQLTALKG